MPELAADVSGSQTPVHFLPDPNPPRLLDETKTAVLNLLKFMNETRFDNAIVDLYNRSKKLAIQPARCGACVWSRDAQNTNRTKESQDVFEKIRASFPNELLPYHALAWQYFNLKANEDGDGELEELAFRIPELEAGQEYSDYEKHLLDVAGRMGNFGRLAAERPVDFAVVKSLNDAITERGPAARTLFLAGVKNVAAKVEEIDAEILDELDAAKKQKLEFDRKRLSFYVDFGYDLVVEHLKAGLETKLRLNTCSCVSPARGFSVIFDFNPRSGDRSNREVSVLR